MPAKTHVVQTQLFEIILSGSVRREVVDEAEKIEEKKGVRKSDIPQTDLFNDKPRPRRGESVEHSEPDAGKAGSDTSEPPRH